MWREGHDLQSTDFSFSRFLTPYLFEFEGWAVFVACDMLVLDDMVNLWNLRDDKYAVQCVKHDHAPLEDTKFLDQLKTKYEKNWSSVMVINAAKCQALTPNYVNTANGLDLHRFHWLGDDNLIGKIPHRWNYLLDYDPAVPIHEVSSLHYTTGGSYFDECKNHGYSDVWCQARDRMLDVGCQHPALSQSLVRARGAT